jgi:outer membrane protein TolC
MILAKRMVPSLLLGGATVGGWLSLSAVIAIGQTVPANLTPPALKPTLKEVVLTASSPLPPEFAQASANPNSLPSKPPAAIGTPPTLNPNGYPMYPPGYAPPTIVANSDQPVVAPGQPIAPANPALNPVLAPPNALMVPTQTSQVQVKQVESLSLEAVVQLAERNNPELEATRLEIDRATAALAEANAANSPTGEVQGTFGHFEDLNPGSGSLRLNTAVRGNYDIYTSGRRSGQIQAAQKQIDLAQLQYDRSQEQLRLDVATDYYDLQEADSQVFIAEAAVRNSQASLKDADSQYQAGLGTKFDVLRSQVQLANNQQQFDNAKSQRASRLRQLTSRLNVAADRSIQTTSVIQPVKDWQLSLEESLLTAYRNRVELSEQLAQRDLSQIQQKVALAALGPTVSVQSQYELQKSYTRSTPGINNGYSLALSARWQFADGGQAQARAKQQAVNQQIAESRHAQTRNTIRLQVEQAYNSLIANRAGIKTTTAAVNQADEALRLSVNRFQAGVGTQTDRISAETDLTRARGNQITAILGYNRAIAQLQRAVSGLQSGKPQAGSLTASARP